MSNPSWRQLVVSLWVTCFVFMLAGIVLAAFHHGWLGVICIAFGAFLCICLADRKLMARMQNAFAEEEKEA